MALYTRVCVVVLVVMQWVAWAEARRTGTSRRTSDHTRPLRAVAWVLAGLFVPLLLLLVWRVARDPLTPHLLRELWARVRECCCRRAPRRRRTDWVGPPIRLDRDAASPVPGGVEAGERDGTEMRQRGLGRGEDG